MRELLEEEDERKTLLLFTEEIEGENDRRSRYIELL